MLLFEDVPIHLAEWIRAIREWMRSSRVWMRYSRVVRASCLSMPKAQQSWIRSQHPPTPVESEGWQMKQHKQIQKIPL